MIRGNRSNQSRQFTDPEIAAQLSAVWKARQAGYSEREIADLTGLSQSTVHRRIAAVWEGYVAPEREAARQWEQSRLDRVLKVAIGLAETAKDPDVKLKAVDRVVRISERRSALLGLDEPTRSVVANVGSELGGDWEQIVAEARATVALERQATDTTDETGGE